MTVKEAKLNHLYNVYRVPKQLTGTLKRVFGDCTMRGFLKLRTICRGINMRLLLLCICNFPHGKEHLMYPIKGLSKCAEANLSPQEVIVLCRCGRVGDMHVDAVAICSTLTAVTQLEEPLNPARRVLRSTTIVAMGEKHH